MGKKIQGKQPGKGRQRSRGQFQQAVEATPAIAGAYHPGIRALISRDRQRLKSPGLATGSIALDEALKPVLPNDPRWDYGIGLPAGASHEQVLWLEVHHAASGETDRVIKKLRWRKGWLRDQAPCLDALPKTFVWLLSNVESNPNDRRRRTWEAEKHGLIRRQGMLDLAEFSGG